MLVKDLIEELMKHPNAEVNFCIDMNPNGDKYHKAFSKEDVKVKHAPLVDIVTIMSNGQEHD